MKYTMLVTDRCNLKCKYCYVHKQSTSMPLDVAQRVIDFIFETADPNDPIDLGFFGGEPLLEFDLLRAIVDLVVRHPRFDPERVEMNVVTNGTILTTEIIKFLNRYKILYCLSCDGPAPVHDLMRHFPDGKGSSSLVENNIKKALSAFPAVLVNAVYHPETIEYLDDVVRYLSDLGVRRIYLNPDITAKWGIAEIKRLPIYYGAVADRYVEYQKKRDPHFISLIDSKIVVLLREGYEPSERCHMGKGEFAFSPNGSIYPCERLINEGDIHKVGTVFQGIDQKHRVCNRIIGLTKQTECIDCTLRAYCMYWCGCTNYLMTGDYDRVHPFLCASEQTSLHIAGNVFRELGDEFQAKFSDHAGGRPLITAGNRFRE